MYSLLLAIIYLAFISLGLPDSLLGSGWPAMQGSLGVPISYAGIISMIIAGGTVISSLLSDRLTRRLGTGLVTCLSVMLTALALVGFSFSSSFWILCLLAIPYGLGAGAVDAALNNYVALHYSARHMSWLHCFWGVGAALSPYIMGFSLSAGHGWNHGYRIVSIIQIVLTAILFVSLPLWKKRTADAKEDSEAGKAKGFKEIFSIKGVKFILLGFFGYCGAESTTGLWASTYLVMEKGIDEETAAMFGSLFFIGITAGRFICGFIADKIGDKQLIRIGLGVMAAGVVIMWMPVAVNILPLAGFMLIGLGCAPIYPSIIHATPFNFGEENSQAVIGIQMASAYIGSTFMPPLFGLIADNINIMLLPVYLMILVALMFIMTEKMNKINKTRNI